MLKSLLIALVVTLVSTIAVADDNDDRVRSITWLQYHNVVMAEDARLSIENLFTALNVPYAKDHTIREIHLAVSITTEIKARPIAERWCERYPDIGDWTFYVNRPNGEFIFATTCPSK